MKTALPIAFAVLIGFAAITMIRGGVAPTPEVFATSASLEDSLRASSESGKPVVAVVTADWCPPCQMLKRETLSDPAVAAWLTENTIPVYINSDERPEDVSMLGVSSLPTTVVLREGQIIAASSGFAKTADYLGFLTGAVE